MRQLWLCNRQKYRRVNVRLFRRILRTALDDVLGVGCYRLAVHLIGSRVSARLNQTFLRHEGPTDVITFAYEPGAEEVSGEIFICVPEAVAQAVRFRTPWGSELVRYAVHGMLHLLGDDDREVQARQRMKRRENRILRRLTFLFPLGELGLGRTV